MTPESEAVVQVASFMALSARTAPKAKGTDTIRIRIVRGAAKNRLSAAMKRYGEEHGIGFFQRDAGNVRNSDAVFLVGCDGRVSAGVDCGACGYPGCAALVRAAGKARKKNTPFAGPNCAVRMADLGIAAGSAAKTASLHNADNRIMYSAGVAAIGLGLLGEGCTVAYGIPLSGTGKNIFFDRTR